MPSSGVQTCALRSEEHTSELQSLTNLVCRLLLEKTSRSHTHLANIFQEHLICFFTVTVRHFYHFVRHQNQVCGGVYPATENKPLSEVDRYIGYAAQQNRGYGH